jgi:hypothetical protein
MELEKEGVEARRPRRLKDIQDAVSGDDLNE